MVTVGQPQAACSAWQRAGARGGARACNPKCVRIFSMTGCSRIAAMIFSSPPQFGQCSMSISNRADWAAVTLRAPSAQGRARCLCLRSLRRAFERSAKGCSGRKGRLKSLFSPVRDSLVKLSGSRLGNLVALACHTSGEDSFLSSGQRHWFSPPDLQKDLT